VSQGWHRYTGDHGEVIAIDTFGASAPGEVMLREYGFTAGAVCKRVTGLLKRNRNE